MTHCNARYIRIHVALCDTPGQTYIIGKMHAASKSLVNFVYAER